MTSPIVVSAATWEATLDLLAPFGRLGLEGGCLWYAVSGEAERVVSLIGVPAQTNYPRSFAIPADSLADLNLAVDPHLTVVAQLHLHPETWTGQSDWDEHVVVSRRVLSVVLPVYGQRPCEIGNCGIHAFDGSAWRRLPDELVGRRIRLDPNGPRAGVLDQR